METAGKSILILSILLLSISTVNAGWRADAYSISTPVWELVCTVLYCAFIQIAGALAALVFVYAGVEYVVAMDDPGKRKAARDMMIYAIVGIIIVGLTNTIIGAILGPGCAGAC